MTSLRGYEKIKRWDFFLSRLAAFGLFGKHQSLLAHRPVQRLFILGSAPLQYLDLKLVADRQGGLREAVVITTCFYSLIGKTIGSPQKHFFFADALRDAEMQRLWLSKPAGAVFVLMTLAKNKRGVSIGLSSQMKLQKSIPDHNEVALIEILRCRDELLLLSAYEQAEVDCAPDRALRILTRMVFLWQKPEAKRAILYLQDTRKIVENNFKIKGLTLPKVGAIGVYSYQKLLFGPHSPVVCLSKFLAYEGALLIAEMQAVQAGVISVAAGPDAFLRLMAARQTGAVVEWQAEGPGILPLWITPPEAEYLVADYKA